MSARVRHLILVYLHSTLCDAVRILHIISEGVVTRPLALCTGLPVCQNHGTEITGLSFHEFVHCTAHYIRGGVDEAFVIVHCFASLQGL